MNELGRIPTASLVGATALAFSALYSYVFFTGTVVYALIDATSSYKALADDLQPRMTIHGAIMLSPGSASASRSSEPGCSRAGLPSP